MLIRPFEITWHPNAVDCILRAVAAYEFPPAPADSGWTDIVGGATAASADAESVRYDRYSLHGGDWRGAVASVVVWRDREC